MEIHSQRVERALKSFALSVLLFLTWGSLTALKARSLRADFAWIELAWVAYNALIAILFLIRSRPSQVSMNPWHWFVALITSFAGLFFARETGSLPPLRAALANVVERLAYVPVRTE